MKKKLDCYLRPYRRRWGLTQKELAYLFGSKSSTVSRVEHQKRQPSLTVAFACQIIFGTAPIELFPGLFAEIEEDVIARAYDLHERLQGNPSKAARIKLDFLEEVFARVKAREHNVNV